MMLRKLTVRSISVVSALALLSSYVPLHAFASEPRYYPYVVYAHSVNENSVSIDSEGICINGTIGTNGSITTSVPYINGDYHSLKDESLTMVNAHYEILDTYFSDALLFTTDIVLDEMNNNIGASIGTDHSFTATGNVSMSASVGAVYDVSFHKGEYGANINASEAVVYSRMGDVTVDCDSFSFCGIIYAPRGTVSITASNVNISGLILAENVIINGNNVNLNYNSHFGEFIGSCMDNPPMSIEDDTAFGVGKDIVVDTTYLSFFDDAYAIKPDFRELNGRLITSSSFESLNVEICDDHGINVFNQTIEPTFNWQTTDLGLLYGDNYVKITAQESNGDFIQKEFILRCCTPEYNDNLMIDREDPDGDGLINYIEDYFGTDTYDPDTDKDGLTDFQEIYDTSTNPLIWDTDENGICDGKEDSDNDGLDNVTEYEIGSLVYAADSDLDGLYDRDEYLTYHTNPSLEDTDGDTLTDAEELDFGSDPLLFDTDNDGISDADQIYTRTLNIQDMGVYYDQSVYPSLSFTSDAKNIASVKIESYDSDCFINPLMGGYIGSAYTFSSERAFDSAILTFTLNEDLYNDPDFLPVIFYFNEETRMLDVVPSQTREANTVSAPLEHFSTYMVLNYRSIQEIWDADVAYIPKSDLEITFVMDYSTSLDENDPNGYRIDVAKEFLDNLGANDKAGAVVFNHDTEITELTNNYDLVRNQIEVARTTTGSTEMWNGLKKGYELFSDEKKSNARRYVILMTDGWSNEYYGSSRYTITEEECYQIRNLKSIDKVFVIALGKVGCNEEVLRRIADKDCFYKLDWFSEEKDFFITSYKSIDDAIQNDNISVDNINSENIYEFDPNKDTNNDGINDYYTAMMCKGYLRSSTFGYVFGYPIHGWKTLYDKVQSNNDFDDDGIINGNEVNISIYSTGHPVVTYKTDPNAKNTDGDAYSDKDEIENLGSNPSIPETVYYDYDTDSLLNNYFMSDEYYSKIRFNALENLAIGIGNYAFSNNKSESTLYKETLYSYLVYNKEHEIKSKEKSQVSQLISDIANAKNTWIGIIWGAFFTCAGDIKPEYRNIFENDVYKYIPEGFFEEYQILNDCEEMLRNCENLNSTSDELSLYFKQIEDLQKQIESFEKAIGHKIPGIRNVRTFSKANKFLSDFGNVIGIIDIIGVGASELNNYISLSADYAIAEDSAELLDVISTSTTNPKLQVAANDMSLAIKGSMVENKNYIKGLVGSVINGSGAAGEKFVITYLIQECSSRLLSNSYGIAIIAGISLGELLGATITPVNNRTECAIRATIMTSISQILVECAASVTRPTIYAGYKTSHIAFHKKNSMQIGIMRNEGSDLKVQRLYFDACTARMFAEQQIIDMLSISGEEGLFGWARNNMSQTINFFVGLASTNDYSTKCDDIIEYCLTTQSYLNALIIKYSVSSNLGGKNA